MSCEIVATTEHTTSTRDADQPIREEAFSAEHLEQHARRLAEQLHVVPNLRGDEHFDARFEDNARQIQLAYQRISSDVHDGAPVTRDAEWILDNFYVVEEQLREIRDDLPHDYYLELPKISNGQPRVYALAIELIAHTDSSLDEETLTRFVREFQKVAPLTIGEVWAIPIMLRLGLVENLRRLTVQAVHARDCRVRAREIVDTWRKDHRLVVDLSQPQQCAPLVLEVLENLALEARENEALRELERQLAQQQLHADQLIRQEHQRQAANQVSIGNVITSMRLISALDWVAFFERTSYVEQVLREDPAEVYAQMDFATRDRYRHVVEALAKRSKHTDLDVARRIVGFAADAPLTRQHKHVQRHIGYWLIGPGREEAERRLDYRTTSKQQLTRGVLRHPELVYFSGVMGFTALVILAAGLSASLICASWWLVLLASLLAILPGTDVAVGLTNYLVTNLLSPHLLPKLEFKEGVPATYPTMVVVPSLLANAHEVQTLLDRLEVHYLANPEPALGFALLTDFADAAHEHLPGDAALVEQVVQGIRTLNERYAGEGRRPFYVFHRARRWNDSEQTWMGWERKRGKLVEFNRLLHGDQTTSYLVQEGDLRHVIGPTSQPIVQFIITLDADTQLPHRAARRLIGALAHPLNRPRMSGSHVDSGYAVLQPRVSVHLGSAHQSWYGRLFSNSAGIDPYTTCASDVYQDLFGEGSFTGKGIYDVLAFEHAIANVLPENQILSHDLIEGCHARVGLVSDIELVDNFPTRYDADARRHHRWIRGDWQIAPWLLPIVPSANGWRTNPLSALSRWKIFDNLRRSLSAAAILLLWLVGWLALPQLAWLWTGLGVLAVGFHVVLDLVGTVRGLRWNDEVPAQLHNATINLGRSLVQTVIGVAFLPYKACSALDAIARTLVRMLITKRKRLEWQTAAATEWQLSKAGSPVFVQMCLVAILAGLLFVVLAPAARWAAAPVLITWLVSPFVLRWLNHAIVERPRTLSTKQERELRRYARQTWAFFETYVRPEDHWLPPDNVQEYPEEKIAHRISPTNEGLFLVSALVARDFGYVGLHPLIEIWERNLEHWTKLDRLNGHFYNWYETTTLQALHPRYVSTVDSGNLAVCFLTLQQGIEALRRAPIMSAELWTGLRETIDLVEEACDKLQPRGARFVSDSLDGLTTAVAALRRYEGHAPQTWLAWEQALAELQVDVEKILAAQQAFVQSRDFPTQEVTAKVQCLLRWFDGVRGDFEALFGWAMLVRRGSDAARLNNNTTPYPLGAADSPELQAAWHGVWEKLQAVQTLASLQQLGVLLIEPLNRLQAILALQPEGAARKLAVDWLSEFKAAIATSIKKATTLDARFARIAARMETLALEMDFRFLYNPQRRLFSIGFNLEEGKLDRAHYDLLCSEARLASYLAIAKGDVEPRHWFQLGRPLTRTAEQLSLLSWGGTMFEFLMPPLFQRNYAGSLLAVTCQTAVTRQQQYGRQHQVPWGISESAFGALAINSDYHYRSFGVPGLGLKRGLTKDLVVSPYSTFLAVEIAPQAAVENLRRLQEEGGLGKWGFYDAVDYSPDRVPPGKRNIIVRCYMSHHQGMSLIAVGNLLFSGRTRELFQSHPLARSTELLLQEKMPLTMPRVQPHADEVAVVELPKSEDELVSRHSSGVETPTPRTHLLANGQYSVMLSSTGGGYSQCRDVLLTRWRSDATQDHWGQFLYLRDRQQGHVWSAAYQPTRVAPDAYEVIYSIDKADFHRRDGALETHLEVAVSPENNAEVRQLTITNHGDETREIEITSYAEVVLNGANADLAHPAFQKLFVETEYIAEETALLARRRPRDAKQAPQWCLHVLAAGDNVVGSAEHESSRQQFLGRGRTPHAPAALDKGAKLSGTTGAVLDPIFSLRCTVVVRPFESTTVAFTTAMAETREEAVILADQYHEPRSVQRAFELAWAYNQVELRHLHISPAKAHLYQRLAGAVLYPDPSRRGATESLLANRLGQPGLWRYGISGDAPIVLLHVTKPDQLPLARELVQAQFYWRRHGLKADLILLNDYPGSYIDELQEQLINLLNDVQRTPEAGPPGVFVLRGSQLAREDRDLLETAAVVVLHGERGSLTQQLDIAAPTANSMASTATIKTNALVAPQPRPPVPNATQRAKTQQQIDTLEFWNGFGGFTRDGREYHIHVRPGELTPMPWSNVIANPQFGCLITESGGGYSWYGNSRENKLTSWSNDPVIDSVAELLYLRDDDSAQHWSPLRDLGDGHQRWVQHGQGYTRFVQESHHLQQEVTVSIAADDPIKFVRVKLTNTQALSRRLSLTYYAEWVLGVNREQTQLHIVTNQDPESQALLARNAYHPEFGEQVAFLQVLGERTVTGDRRAFIGRNGDLNAPAGLSSPLAGTVGAGLDPCGVVRTSIRLEPHQTQEIVFLIGSAENLPATRALLAKYRTLDAVHTEQTATQQRWDETLSTVEFHTPDRAFDLLANRWLLYQTLSCRFWGRSAFYQAGGAYGFRDQLQDVMALTTARPELAREQLLRAAARQFETGDVQHWWHPPAGRGTRTRFSDDLLWLPLVACHYVQTTGDVAVLDEVASFLTSPPLEKHEHERYELPSVSSQKATLFEHCRRAIDRGFQLGPHGLPLMGCGDWNDGMNKVGELGQGESIWVGWFLLVLLKRFLPLAAARGETAWVQEYEAKMAALRTALETHAWDGAWYRRAYFDDGTPLGSATNDECQIDSIAQSWAVLADADPQRTRQAMHSATERLVRTHDKLVLLFTPPFDRTTLDPGYIKGYLPGIRENGGQYTHSALWFIQALTQLGEADEASRIFSLINPINHAASPAEAQHYQTEPYVIAADVYGVAPHTGRGGWSWYTGSAAWMYRVAVESILGLEMYGDHARFKPCLPAHWPGYRLTLRRGQTTWNFTVSQQPAHGAQHNGNCNGAAKVAFVDVPLLDDGGTHDVAVHLGETNHAQQSAS